MNAAVVLEALQKVEAVGCVSPTVEPMDILGVLLTHVAGDGKGLGEKLDLVKRRCEIEISDVDDLFALAEMVKDEGPVARRDRLIDYFAGMLDRQQIAALPPEDANLHEGPDR